MSGWPTTRRYSRTLAEAFPCERAQAIEHAHHALITPHELALIAVCILSLALGFVFGW